MSRLLLILVTAAAVLPASAAAAMAAGFAATPVARLPFPERGYVVDLPQDVSLDEERVKVTENGLPVRLLTITPLATSGLRSGVVLAIDASESMMGAPFRAAQAAARKFVLRRDPGQEVGLVAFNGSVRVLQAPTDDAATLKGALDSPPALAYGTRIYDALDRSIALLARSRLSTGAVVLLSDGSDIGSREDVKSVVTSAARHHIRVFTVGLRSRAFDPEALRTLAERTGGAYAEATTSAELATIYATLGERFAREYLVQYRSNAPAESDVSVRIAIRAVGVVREHYTAPTPAGVDPYHRSALTRFLLSSASIFVLALLLAGLVAWVVWRTIRGPQTHVVERITQFSGGPAVRPDPMMALRPRRMRYTSGWWARLERDLEIARVDLSARAVVAWTLAATALLTLVIAAVAPIVALVALLVPLLARAVVRRKLRGVRIEFAEQLPANLQVLASALRSGHSFSGALTVVVENAHEPAESELRRILRDDQFGVPPEEAIRKVANRMQNRDLEQVALLAELQRTSGGNAAEVLDTVVATIRERAELRRLVRTLTAQGRMARWILTALPIGVSLFLWALQPTVMSVLFESMGGQIALVVAATLVVVGSIAIQRIIEIDV